MSDDEKGRPREEDLTGLRVQARLVVWTLGPLTVLGVVALAAGLGPIILTAVIAAWAVFGIYAVVYVRIVEPAAEAAGRLLMPRGSSTPPPKPLSHIEAMVARGDLARAAEAYRAEILSDPEDVTSCERLGNLALREMGDLETALWALREAERRVPDPRRRVGYALLVAGIYRDNLRDAGKAVVELRRILATYPDVPNAAALRAEIDELKAGLFDETRGREREETG